MQHKSTCSCSRRHFLRGCGVTLTGFGIASVLPTPLVQHAMAMGTSDRRMLFIFLRGGSDGINMVIPNGDADYNVTNRPNLYIPPGSSIDLGNGFGRLHPALGDLMDGFNAGDMAILHRIGYPNSSQSHFDGQRIWENGDPTQPQLFEGWLYRYVRDNMVSAGVDLPAMTVQATPPVLMRGDEKFVNVANPDSFDYLDGDPKRSKYNNAWRNLNQNLIGLEPYRPVLSQTGVKLADTLDTYRSWDQANWHPKNPNGPNQYLFPVDEITNDDQANPGTPLFSANAFPFFRSLKVCALSLLESDGGNTNGTRIAGTQLGGWDLHSNQVPAGDPTGGNHAELMSWLAYGMESLRLVLSGSAINEPRGYASIWSKTLIATMSEFGRTSIENGSFGTDHAAASAMFLSGGTVNGGLYNIDNSTWFDGGATPNPLFSRDGRYLEHRTDFRAVFWEIVRDHMEADPLGVEGIFPGYTAAGLASQELGVIV